MEQFFKELLDKLKTKTSEAELNEAMIKNLMANKDFRELVEGVINDNL